MAGAVDLLYPEHPRQIAVLASNPAVSEKTGWPIGFWWAELTHSYWELNEHGYQLEICSPDGGKLEGDSWSDPRDESGYSAHDLVSLGFINSPEHMKLVEQSKPLAELRVDDYDAIILVGGQGRITRSSTMSGCTTSSSPSMRQGSRPSSFVMRPARS
jgi:hypothetical protein